jgi:hypothetical protein
MQVKKTTEHDLWGKAKLISLTQEACSGDFSQVLSYWTLHWQ